MKPMTDLAGQPIDFEPGVTGHYQPYITMRFGYTDRLYLNPEMTERFIEQLQKSLDQAYRKAEGIPFSLQDKRMLQERRNT